MKRIKTFSLKDSTIEIIERISREDEESQSSIVDKAVKFYAEHR